MATFAQTHTPEASPGLRARFDEMRAGWRAAAARRHRFAEVRAELRALSDRDLADIGISRLSIDDIARAAAYGRA